jgi:hypothetical protein
MKMMKIIFVLLFLILLVVLPLSGSQADLMQKRFDTEPGKQTELDYSGVDDDVVINTHEKSEILFKFKKELRGSKSGRNTEYFEGIQPELDFSGNRLTVRIKYPRRTGNIFRLLSGFRVKITSTLWVPVNTDVKIKVVDGDAAVSGLRGDIRLRSVDGDLMVKRCEGTMELHTVDGGIEVDGCSGNLKTGTTDGDVNASGAFNGIYFKSVDGDGRFTLAKESVLEEDCWLKTVDGDVCLTFEEDLAFRLLARTGDGSIRLHHLEFNKILMKKKDRFEGERGDAHYTIEIKTSDGDISLSEY